MDGKLKSAKDFKIVYVAPMKALAAEIVRKFSQRLGALGIVVKELTGDMQLTRTEVEQTHMVVTTPEKYDVITRKPNEISQILRLLIIDEVHLLHDERGCVIEALVARTRRLCQSLQTSTRIVGLSATLPNVNDVATFLGVPKTGLLVFDGTYRPVPLEQTFIGVTDNNNMLMRKLQNQVCLKKVEASIHEGYQVMVFVHSRKETRSTAIYLREHLNLEKFSNLVEMQNKEPLYHRTMKSRLNEESLRDLLPRGYGIHHAGMQRSDRSKVERLFEKGCLKVLCSTATLAWGVNLPAHTVIIKGTTLYSPEKGGFWDLGILDVLQIFGRAGRPQFESTGHAMIITGKKKLTKYLRLLMHQDPIESSMHKGLANHLNAEIQLGTVTNVEEGIEWLSYTYLFVRMIKNPLSYGIEYDELDQDPQLRKKRIDLITNAGKRLYECKMSNFGSETFKSTHLGRTAAHYYVDHDTMEMFNTHLNPLMEMKDRIYVVSMCKEFSQLKVREDEHVELEKLLSICPYKDHKNWDITDSSTKANILLQLYIGKKTRMVRTQTIIADLYNVTQSAGRIIKAIFEIVLRKGWGNCARGFLELCKMFERRLWGFEHPVKQFNQFNIQWAQKLEDRSLWPERIVEMDAGEIGELLRVNRRNANIIIEYAKRIPFLDIECEAKPMTRHIMKLKLTVLPNFRWVKNQHGSSQSFLLMVDHGECFSGEPQIYHHEMLKITHKQWQSDEDIVVNFTVPITDPMPNQYYIHSSSEHWMGSDGFTTVDFAKLVVPEDYPANTKLLALDPVPITALKFRDFEELFPYKYFNPIQSQVFWLAYHTDQNILMGAPTGSGKTVCAELAVFRSLKKEEQRKIVYIAPLKALARERRIGWTKKFGSLKLRRRTGEKFSFKGCSIVEMTGDRAPDRRAIEGADILITTPEKWDGVSRYWNSRSYVRKVGLIIIDEIHLLGADRGPILEVIISRLRFVEARTDEKVRVVGLSTALANAEDLGDWLGIERKGIFNFPPSQRPIPCTVHIEGFSGKHYCPRMAKMNKPSYQAIQRHAKETNTLIFVSSRRQTRLTALDLITLSTQKTSTVRPFVNMDGVQLEWIVKKKVKDRNLAHTLVFGIGLHHAGLHPSDKQLVEDLFTERKIRVLIATSTLAWGVNLPAHLVVVKGTEFYDPKLHRYVPFPITDLLQMIGRAGRPGFDTHAVAYVMVEESRKDFYKKFLYTPFPVESSLHEVIHDHINAEIATGTIQNTQDGIEWLTWTFLFRRLLKNPTYYQIEDRDAKTINRFLKDTVGDTLRDLEEAGCVKFDDEDRSKFHSTSKGEIASYYYLKYETMALFESTLKDKCTINDLLRALCDTKEYEELPVRHNEDKLNEELAGLVPWPVDDYSMDEPSAKANLLFQAHFARLPLPISDYITDTRSVMDQAIRICQAMIDITAASGWLEVTLKTMNLLQMIVQGRWLTDSTLMNLPGLNPQLIELLWKHGIETLPELMASPPKKIEHILKTCETPMSATDYEELAKVLNTLIPIIDVELPRSIQDCEVGDKFTLCVRHRRLSGTPNKVYAPRWTKTKLEGWFLVLAAQPEGCGEKEEGICLSVKRIRCERRWRTGRLEVDNITLEPGEYILTIYLMSDTYLGLDQVYTRRLNVFEPIPMGLEEEDLPEGEIEMGEPASIPYEESEHSPSNPLGQQTKGPNPYAEPDPPSNPYAQPANPYAQPTNPHDQPPNPYAQPTKPSTPSHLSKSNEGSKSPKQGQPTQKQETYNPYQFSGNFKSNYRQLSQSEPERDKQTKDFDPYFGLK